jgi:hypothetical protein
MDAIENDMPSGRKIKGEPTVTHTGNQVFSPLGYPMAAEYTVEFMTEGPEGDRVMNYTISVEPNNEVQAMMAPVTFVYSHLYSGELGLDYYPGDVTIPTTNVSLKNNLAVLVGARKGADGNYRPTARVHVPEEFLQTALQFGLAAPYSKQGDELLKALRYSLDAEGKLRSPAHLWIPPLEFATIWKNMVGVPDYY